jgi:hypothetical protein
MTKLINLLMGVAVSRAEKRDESSISNEDQVFQMVSGLLGELLDSI